MLQIFNTKKGAIIKIVYGCNHTCSFCHERDNIFSLNFKNILPADLEKIYKWLQQYSFDYVIISGGEPTLHPHLVDIIKFFQEKKLYVVIVNNGSHLHKHDFSTIDPNKITFYISYHGLEKEYNEITSSNDYDQVTQNIHTIREQFPEVILRYVVNSKNYRKFREYSDYVLGEFPGVYLEYVMVEDLRHSHVPKTTISLQDYYKLILEYIKNPFILLDGGAACLNIYLFKNAQAKFDPLVNTMVGLVKKTTNGEITFSIKQGVTEENIKSTWKKCKTCVKYNHCHGFDISYIQKD